MKIVFLNAWHGTHPEELAVFFNEHLHDTDILCLQEASDEVKQIYSDIFSDYQEFSDYKYNTENDDFPQATLVKNGINIISSKSLFKDDSTLGLTLYTELEVNGRHLHLCNVHGSARPGNKLDSPGRLKQSEELIKLFKDSDDPVIIGGDFNIEVGTESIEMFTRGEYHDLIKDHEIKTTRNHYAWDLYPGNELYYSDYVFLKNVKVQEFAVIDNEVSDHLPMVLNVEI